MSSIERSGLFKGKASVSDILVKHHLSRGIIDTLQIQVDLLRTITESKEQLGRKNSPRAYYPGITQAQPDDSHTVGLSDDQGNTIMGAHVRGAQSQTWKWSGAYRNDPAIVWSHASDAS